MAILRGFPPSNTISPSVRITEKDLSFINPDQSFHRAGLVGFASKGPINIPTVIQSRRQLNTVFGFPHPEQGDPYLLYAAEQYLMVANELYVVRVADTDTVSWERAKEAEVELPSAGGAVEFVSSKPGNYRLDKDMYFRWRLNGQLASKTLVALADDNHPDPVVQADGYSASQLANDLNLQLDSAIDGIKFFSTTEVSSQITKEVKSTSSTVDSAEFELNNGNLIAGSVTGRVMVGGVNVQSFKVNEDGVFTFKTLVSSSVKAVSGTLDLGDESTDAKITLDYNGPLPLAPSSSSGVSSLNYNSVSVDYKFVTEYPVSRLGVMTTFSFGPKANLELVSVQDALYGPTVASGNVHVGPTGLGSGMEVAQTTGSVAADFNFTSLDVHDLHVVVDGTDNVSVDNVVQVIDLSALATNSSVTVDDVVNKINDELENLPGGFEAVAVGDYVSLRTLHAGNDARLLVKDESSVFELLGFDKPLYNPTNPAVNGPDGTNKSVYTTAYGYSPEGTSGDVAISTYGLVRGDNNRYGDVSVTLHADSPGIEGNSTQVVIKNDVREGNFVMEVYNNGVQVESWGNLTKDETSRFYVETFLSLVSDYVRATDNTANKAPPLDGIYNLTGGNDGIPSDPDDQDKLLIGNRLGYSGIYALSEPEQVDLDLIAVPGHSSTGVVMALIEMCQTHRMDCMAIIDAPFGLTVKEIIHWQNGAHPLNTTRFDSDFAALYWPWVKIRDSYNNVDVWVPPSGSVMAVYARSDSLSAPWFAPAGVNRGVVPGITDVFSRPTMEERDLMYGNRNAINPIVQYADFQDYVVWGQKTLQRKPTALDRVNVRRLMFVIEKRIRQASRELLFEPHDERLHDRFISIATRILTDVQIGRGLTNFIIKADAELNTPDVIDRNEFRARIGVQPTRAVEFIFLEFSLHRTGTWESGTDTF
jgi:hypothetical protein